jgi:hypothetical protein
MSTLRERYENGQRPVKVTVTVPLDTLIRLEGIARQRGMSRREALEDAICWWNVRQEQQLTRKHRIMVEGAMRAAADREPVGVVLERLRRGLQEVDRAAEHKDSPEGLTGDGNGAYNVHMSASDEPVETQTKMMRVSLTEDEWRILRVRAAEANQSLTMLVNGVLRGAAERAEAEAV